MKVVMTLLVRDEEDILAANLDFHLAQGVDRFIVTDNLSLDGTPDIIDAYARQGVVTSLRETDDDYAQHRWVTRMARMAAHELAADWVINSDADEFWTPTHGAATLRDQLARIPAHVDALQVPRYNFVPVINTEPALFAERMTVRETLSRNGHGVPLPPKICHRAHPDVAVAQGNHAVSRDGLPLSASPCNLHILHFPLRTYEQFANKIARGGAAYMRNRDLPADVGRTWRELYARWQQGTLKQDYARHLRSPAAMLEQLDDGTLVRDETVRDVLRRVFAAHASAMRKAVA